MLFIIMYSEASFVTLIKMILFNLHGKWIVYDPFKVGLIALVLVSITCFLMLCEYRVVGS